jgi:hypothetical protein
MGFHPEPALWTNETNYFIVNVLGRHFYVTGLKNAVFHDAFIGLWSSPTRRRAPRERF